MKNRNRYFAAGKNVLIWGLGIAGGGVGAANFFILQQAKEVVVTDKKNESQLKKEVGIIKKSAKKHGVRLRFVLGKHSSQLFKEADIVVQNPAIPNTSPYWKYIDKKKLVSDISIFFKNFFGIIVGITGTKGKSTTATLVHHILTVGGKKNFLAGNIGISVLDSLTRSSMNNIAVVELSSFGLETLAYCKKSPHIAVITNIFEDHLNRYANFSSYAKAKMMITRYQKRGDILIVNFDDPVLQRIIKKQKARVLWYSTKAIARINNKIFASVRNGSFYVGKTKVCDTSAVEKLGEHTQSNALAAVTTAFILGVPIKHIASALAAFRGLPGRYQCIGTIKGASVINDTCATNPLAAAKAIDTASKYYKKIYLIAGGVDKQLPYAPFAQSAKRSSVVVYLVPGSASDLIAVECAKIGHNQIHRVMNFNDAFKMIIPVIRKGDCLILSPAAASFNMFKNEFDRGSCFVKVFRIFKNKYEGANKKS